MSSIYSGFNALVVKSDTLWVVIKINYIRMEAKWITWNRSVISHMCNSCWPWSCCFLVDQGAYSPDWRCLGPGCLCCSGCRSPSASWTGTFPRRTAWAKRKRRLRQTKPQRQGSPVISLSHLFIHTLRMETLDLQMVLFLFVCVHFEDTKI